MGGYRQFYNAEMREQMTPDFQRRNEPNFAWKSAVSALLALPALRGAWPMSSVDYTVANRAVDVSGQGNHLTDVNAVQFGYDDLAPYVQLVSANTEYLSRADGGVANWADITGLETYVLAAQRGWTVSMWLYSDTAGTNEVPLSKWNVAGSRSYLIQRLAGNTIRAGVSVDGTAQVFSANAPFSALAWHHVVARFTPSTELTIFVDGISFPNAVAIPASIFDSVTNFEIGRLGSASQYWDGRVSHAAMCAVALSDAIIGALYHQQRSMFGV